MINTTLLNSKVLPFLNSFGYSILAVNSRPIPTDKRICIDLIAYDPSSRSLRAIIVKTHSFHSSANHFIPPYEKQNHISGARAFAIASNPSNPPPISLSYLHCYLSDNSFSLSHELPL